MIRILAALILLLPFGLLTSQAHGDATSISADEAVNHVGESARVCGKVASAKYATETRRQPTFLNLDRPYPNHVFTALIWGSDRAAFPYAPEEFESKRICVKGNISLHKGKAQIIVTAPSQIEVKR